MCTLPSDRVRLSRQQERDNKKIARMIEEEEEENQREDRKIARNQPLATFLRSTGRDQCWANQCGHDSGEEEQERS